MVYKPTSAAAPANPTVRRHSWSQQRQASPTATSRRLAQDYTDEPDWTPVSGSGSPSAALAQAASLLETETFSKAFAHDALNRPTSATMPDLSELRPTYNEAGFLEAVDARLRGATDANGAPVWTAFVTAIAYDEKGRRTRIDYGNGTFTEYFYDALSFRLTRLRTTRSSDAKKLQDLFYFYDPVGNITTIRDDAHPEVFFAGQQVVPTQEFEYDALYRLIWATGREHAGGVGDVQRDQNDLPLWDLPHPNDAQALRRYTETYLYDGVGNIREMFHDAGNGSPGTWRRRYAYGANPFGPGAPSVPASNRLHSTSLPGDAEQGPYTAGYVHDANGNMVAMPHLAEIAYTHADQMKRANLGGGGTAYYTYDAGGERVRKVIQRLGTTREERIYLGGWELYRKRQGAGGDVVLERETLHVMDDVRRIALVETKTVDAEVPGALAIASRVRFQYSNHLDSAHLECDATGLVISYEEYHPYGTPTYRSARSGVEISERRYRYTGKERDDETGFGYHSARYYVSWLGRWTTADPKGMVDGCNLYAYARCCPSAFSDPRGAQSVTYEEALASGALRYDTALAFAESSDAARFKTSAAAIEFWELAQRSVPAPAGSGQTWDAADDSQADDVDAVDPNPVFRVTGVAQPRPTRGMQQEWTTETFPEHGGYSYTYSEPDTRCAEILANLVLGFAPHLTLLHEILTKDGRRSVFRTCTMAAWTSRQPGEHHASDGESNRGEGVFEVTLRPRERTCWLAFPVGPRGGNAAHARR